MHITLSINVQPFNHVRSIESTTYLGAHAVNCSMPSLSSQPETPAVIAVACSLYDANCRCGEDLVHLGYLPKEGLGLHMHSLPSLHSIPSIIFGKLVLVSHILLLTPQRPPQEPNVPLTASSYIFFSPNPSEWQSQSDDFPK